MFNLSLKFVKEDDGDWVEYTPTELESISATGDEVTINFEIWVTFEGELEDVPLIGGDKAVLLKGDIDHFGSGFKYGVVFTATPVTP